MKVEQFQKTWVHLKKKLKKLMIINMKNTDKDNLKQNN